MAKKPDEYSIQIMLDGGHREEVRVSEPKEVSRLMNEIFTSGSDAFVRLPRPLENEFLIVRPSRVCAVLVEAVYRSEY